MDDAKALDPAELFRRCDPDSFDFDTTDELDDPDEVLGQKRALEAIRFAMGMKRDGYNLFALGPNGLGKHAVVRHVIEARAAEAPTPPDWCYVFNFDDSQKPRSLRLPAGLGGKLKAHMTQLLQDLHAAIPAAFKSAEYRTQRDSIEAEVKQRHEQVIAGIQQQARERGVALLRTPAGLGFAAMHEGEVIEPEAFEKLPEAERVRIQETISSLQGSLQIALRELSGLVSHGRQRVRDLNRDVTRYAASHLIDALSESYEGVEDVIGYLDTVRKDVVENDETFAPSDVIMPSAPAAADSVMPAPPFQPSPQEASVERYGVNVLVDSSVVSGAPVIYEDHPTYQRLIGEIEHVAHMGALVTDFTLIKGGALHRANGGYLILDGRKL
ncbi:MAG: ATP-binding protein, partial [Alphaproteobacteria bacterium]